MIRQVLDGRYLITKDLGKGGFGHTFIAEDTKRPGNPICVVKKLKPYRKDPAFVQKAQELFIREAETLEKLGEDSQIPRLLAHFEENKEFYLVQEFIAGNTLTKELQFGNKLTEAKVINLLLDLLEVLAFVHKNGVIHRDIKPENIIRRQSDQKLVLIDFGAVKEVTTLGQSGTIPIGTPGYIPHEQSAGNPKLSSDVYAVGKVALFALTGINPSLPSSLGFKQDNQGEIIWREHANVSDKLAAILDKMVRHDYRQRYSSAKEALQAVQGLQPKPKPHKKWLIGGIAVILVAIFGGILGKIFFSQSLSPYPRLPLNGKVVNGEIENGDRSENPLDKNLTDTYVFSGRQGQEISIEITSDAIDPGLILRDTEGNEIDRNEDIAPDNRNAHLQVILPENGTYFLTATSFDSELGSYQLRASLR
ncbi:MAG: protein kinase [Oscillatoria sp. PMC 1068.18]|nr:protein kinase [Oscillatoria sp. PMC 1076.18]MEC4987456.1 protein kinase [Oscillatoria sp. PMC 1068.18]